MGRSRRRALALALLAAVAVVAALLVGGRSSARGPAGGGAGGAVAAPRAAIPRATAAPVRVASRADLAVTGIVLSAADGRPVSGAAVALAGGGHTISDEGGRFAIVGVAEGAHVVQATHGDAASDPARVHVRPGAASRVVLRLFDAARLSVTVVSAGDRQPVAGAHVEVRCGAWGEPIIRSGITDDAGRVVLRGLSSDSYVISAVADGFEGVEQALPPRAGLEWSHELALARGASVAGRVVDARGRPIGAARVSVLSARKAHRVSVTYQGAFDVATDDAGFFLVPAVAAGDVILRAAHPDHVPAWSAPVATDGRTPRAGIVIALADGAVLDGHVVTAAGAPAVGAIVRVAAVDPAVLGGGARAATCDHAGRFRLAGLPDTDVDVVASSAAASSATVRVDLSKGRGEAALRLAQELAIAGVVTGPDHEPIPGATVVCVGRAMGSIGTRPVLPETTDEEGRFWCKGLGPGTYELTAMKPGNNNNTGPWQRSAGTVADAGDDDVMIMIPNDGGVRGRVRTARGGVPESFGVELDTGGLPRLFESRDGTFHLDGLAPRTYQLVITAPGARAIVSASIPEGGSLELGTITLMPAPVAASSTLGFRPPVAGSR